LYTFRTPDGYYLALRVDPDGRVADWSATVPGIARPLHATGVKPRAVRRVVGGTKGTKRSERAARGGSRVKSGSAGGSSRSDEPSAPSAPGRTL
jgi:hypothetical protein